jgi:hypothetical protein
MPSKSDGHQHGIPSAGLFWPPWKSFSRRTCRGICVRSLTAFGHPWKRCWRRSFKHDPEALVRHAVRANIRVSASHLRRVSEVLEHLIQKEGLLVRGAEYSLETGVVDFFDRVPEAGYRWLVLSVRRRVEYGKEEMKCFGFGRVLSALCC